MNRGMKAQQIYDSGRLLGRTLRATGKQVYCGIVHIIPSAVVQTVERALGL